MIYIYLIKGKVIRLNSHILNVRNLGLQHWHKVYSAMQNFTNSRDEESLDELWLAEHFPIFTYGKYYKGEKLFQVGDFPMVESDRGGQVTYHGPGQQLIYTLINIKRRKISIRKLVSILEETIITTLSYFGIQSYSKKTAPGVYVNKKKFLLLD